MPCRGLVEINVVALELFVRSDEARMVGTLAGAVL
jgi:hypothetical protein